MLISQYLRDYFGNFKTPYNVRQLLFKKISNIPGVFQLKLLNDFIKPRANEHTEKKLRGKLPHVLGKCRLL